MRLTNSRHVLVNFVLFLVAAILVATSISTAWAQNRMTMRSDIWPNPVPQIQAGPPTYPSLQSAGHVKPRGDIENVAWNTIPPPTSLVRPSMLVTDNGKIQDWAAPYENELSWQVLARTYFANDQRLQWSGQEATFAVEGALVGKFGRTTGNWEIGVETELFFNQPYDRNILVDTPERVSYKNNFEIDPFEISQLFLSARNGDWQLSMGRIKTPFGRTHFPLYRNDFRDGPFIRTESILWRETGIFLQSDPGNWVNTVAIVNGSKGQDTNSMKSLIARVGYETENGSLGASIKCLNRIGSEGQKFFNNHVGIDAMRRWGCWTLSAEIIYDEYGARRPSFDPLNMFWPRSIYYRDQNFADDTPINGLGYYLNVTYQSDTWQWMFNYGEFMPEQIGDPLHDVTNRRGIVKASRKFFETFEFYTMIIIENDVENAQAGRTRKGLLYSFGGQFVY
jgi:hypothetical protein